MNPAQSAALRRRKLAMQQALMQQWANVPQANVVLRKRRAAGLLGLGEDESVLAEKRRELARVREERMAVEAELASFKRGIRSIPQLQPGSTSKPQPVVLAKAPGGISWKHLLFAGGLVAWLARRRK